MGGRYGTFSTAQLGLHQVLPPKEVYRPHQRFGMYRWHLHDPICFERDLRVTVQALGWKAGRRYLPLVDADIATTAFWYQTAHPVPAAARPAERGAQPSAADRSDPRAPGSPRVGIPPRRGSEDRSPSTGANARWSRSACPNRIVMA